MKSSSTTVLCALCPNWELSPLLFVIIVATAASPNAVMENIKYACTSNFAPPSVVYHDTITSVEGQSLVSLRLKGKCALPNRNDLMLLI